MTIQRIESLVFGVDDLEACTRFYQDAGLELVEAGPGGAELATRERQSVVLRAIDDPGLPPALESQSTIREIVWGVSDAASVDRLADELARDREVVRDADGTVHSHDETGFGIAFRVAREQRVPDPPAPTANTLRRVARWNTPVSLAEDPRPIRFAHMALNIPKAGHLEAIAFYLDRLGFKATDVLVNDGTFLRCPGDNEHHNLALFHRPDVAGFNHASLEMPDLDSLILAGNRMIEQGWEEGRTLGRHLLGSNYYRFVHSPAGGKLEFVYDMDRVDDDFEIRVWDTNPGHHLWVMATHGMVDLPRGAARQ